MDKVLWVILLGIFVGCSSSSVKTPPAPKGAATQTLRLSGGDVKLPPIEETRLANGLTILFVPDSALPYVSYSLILKTGSRVESEKDSGLSNLVADLINKGSAKRDAMATADAFGQLGAEFKQSVSSDFSLFTAGGLATDAEPLAQLFYETVTDPSFNEAEVQRSRQQILAGLRSLPDSPQTMADRAFDAFLFGPHPYGRSVWGTLKTLPGIKRRNIIQHYLKYYRPNNAILSVVGQLTPELKARLQQIFSTWEARDVQPVQVAAPPPVQGLQILLVDKPGQVQAQIQLGHLGIKRGDPDFITLRVANTIVGGAFASRLMDRVRKELGLTYGINSSFDSGVDRGSFMISTFTKNSTTGQMVREILSILKTVREQGMTSQEVEMVRGYLRGTFPQAIETPEKLAFNMMLLRVYGVPDTYLTTYLREIASVSVSDVNRAWRAHVDERNMKLVVYGSAAEIKSQLEPFGKIQIKQAKDLL